MFGSVFVTILVNKEYVDIHFIIEKQRNGTTRGQKLHLSVDHVSAKLNHI